MNWFCISFSKFNNRLIFATAKIFITYSLFTITFSLVHSINLLSNEHRISKAEESILLLHCRFIRLHHLFLVVKGGDQHE